MRIWLTLAALNGLLAVAIGAFAAHALQATLPGDRLGWVETAARYHMVHSLALLACAWLADRIGGWLPRIAGSAFAAGIVLFCGGLYAAAVADLGWVMPVVPVGGSGFLAGWAALLWLGLRRPRPAH